MKNSKKSILAISAFLLLMNARVQAQWYTFIGSGSWSSASNWDSIGIPPNPLLTGTIEIKGSAVLDLTQTVLSGAFQVQASNSLTINQSNSLTIHTSLNNLGTLIIDGNLVCNSGGWVGNYSSIINNGTYSGNFINWTNTSTFTNNGILKITKTNSPNNNGILNNYEILIIDTNQTLYNEFLLNNYGILNIYGELENYQTATLNNTGSLTNFATGTITSTGILTNSATLTVDTGGVVVMNPGAPGAIFNNNSGGTFTNSGSWSIIGTSVTNDGSLINNSEGSVIISSTFENNGILNNSGSFETNGILNNNINGSIFNNLSGEISINTGGILTNTDSISNFGTMLNIGIFNQNQNFLQNGTYKGANSLPWTTMSSYNGNLFTNNGTVTPGLTTGCLDFDSDYANVGTLRIEINWINPCFSFDGLNVSGLATAGGVLEVNFAFAPSVGQSFQIINAGSYAGNFSNISVTPNHTVSYSNGVITVISLEVNIITKAILGGPYIPIGDTMSTALHNMDLLSIKCPYDTTIMLSFLPSTMVDWVRIDLVDTLTGDTVYASQCACLLRNGGIEDITGDSTLAFSGVTTPYISLRIKHRNHLSTRTRGLSNIPGVPISFDFRDGTNLYVDPTITGGAFHNVGLPEVLTGTRYALWPGDVNGDGQVKYQGSANDRGLILSAIGGTVITNTVSGYLPADITLNGQVKYQGSGNDRGVVLSSIGGAVITKVSKAHD